MGLERIVRPNVTLESHLRDRTPAPVEVPEQEAEIRWGRASTFQWSTTNPPSTSQGGGISVHVNPTEQNDNTEPGPMTITFEEIGQLTQQDAVRIFNPNDNEQYVDVARILDMTTRPPANWLDALIAQKDGTITELFVEIKLHPQDRPEVRVNDGN